MEKRPTCLLLLTAVLVSCGGGSSDVSTEKKGPELVIGGEDASAHVNSIYQMPTPNELFSVVRQLDGAGRKSAMSPASNADGYASLSARALNFGTYATDLVYASNFRLTSEVVRYYLACKKLGGELGLSQTFSSEIQSRLERNITHGDSLDVISNDAYYNAYERLHDQQMGPVLTLALAGGWIESMHLVMDQVQAFDAASPLMDRITDQKLGVEHLVDMMAQFPDDQNIGPVRTQLLAIRDIYDKLNIQRTPHQGASPSGRMVLGDDVTISMTAEKYNELKAAVEHMRDGIIRSENQAAIKPNA